MLLQYPNHSVYLMNDIIHSVLQKQCFSQWKIPKVSSQHINFSKCQSDSGLEKQIHLPLYFQCLPIYFIKKFIYKTFSFWFTFANAVVIYTAVFFLQAVVRTRTVTSRYSCLTTTEISACPRSGLKLEGKKLWFSSLHVNFFHGNPSNR